MMFLTKEELVALTGRSRSDAQLRVMRSMGIDHRIRPDGSIVVSRSHVERLLGSDTVEPEAYAHSNEPLWSMMETKGSTQ